MRVIVIIQQEHHVLAVVHVPEGSDKDATFRLWAADPGVSKYLDAADLAAVQVEEVEVVELKDENPNPVRTTEGGHVAMTMPGCNYKVSDALSDWIVSQHQPHGDAIIVTPQYLKALVADGTAVKRGETYFQASESAPDPRL